ncbi:hypothetical protein ACFWMR_29790 [Amycolatopsis thailandensis]|uniref:hypothetical protein n=1 Tax=Amycolatopsis thailandensis TaxID=589330 RepID=UPI0036630DF8
MPTGLDLQHRAVVGLRRQRRAQRMLIRTGALRRGISRQRGLDRLPIPGSVLHVQRLVRLPHRPGSIGILVLGDEHRPRHRFRPLRIEMTTRTAVKPGAGSEISRGRCLWRDRRSRFGRQHAYVTRIDPLGRRGARRRRNRLGTPDQQDGDQREDHSSDPPGSFDLTAQQEHEYPFITTANAVDAALPRSVGDRGVIEGMTRPTEPFDRRDHTRSLHHHLR